MLNLCRFRFSKQISKLTPNKNSPRCLTRLTLCDVRDLEEGVDSRKECRMKGVGLAEKSERRKLIPFTISAWPQIETKPICYFFLDLTCMLSKNDFVTFLPPLVHEHKHGRNRNMANSATLYATQQLQNRPTKTSGN